MSIPDSIYCSLIEILGQLPSTHIITPHPIPFHSMTPHTPHTPSYLFSLPSPSTRPLTLLHCHCSSYPISISIAYHLSLSLSLSLYPIARPVP